MSLPANTLIDDVVECDVGGRRFYAKVTGRDGREVLVRPITHNISYRRVRSNQVIGYYRKLKIGRG